MSSVLELTAEALNILARLTAYGTITGSEVGVAVHGDADASYLSLTVSRAVEESDRERIARAVLNEVDPAAVLRIDDFEDGRRTASGQRSGGGAYVMVTALLRGPAGGEDGE